MLRMLDCLIYTYALCHWLVYCYSLSLSPRVFPLMDHSHELDDSTGPASFRLEVSNKIKPGWARDLPEFHLGNTQDVYVVASLQVRSSISS